ncbi:hypothetical protein ACQPVP_05165 [Clostridium nigeriense]|uniref:hypothetical protein n=1 Tax=Clostridium nigeriense TaxID=1805470 RepID=UPI003D34D3C9
MKNKIHFIIASLLTIVSLTLTLVGAILNFKIIIFSIISLVIGIYLLMYWSTLSYKWKCDTCGKIFEITLKQNVFGKNIGVNYKELFCPHCLSKTNCKGIKVK